MPQSTNRGSKMAEKIVIGVLVGVIVLLNAFLVVALVTNDNLDIHDSTRDSLKVIELDNELEDSTEYDELEVPITGSDLEIVSATALAYIGEGKVTDSEVGDEEGYYEIEITLNDGDQVDVHLDENFKILSTEYD